MIETSEPTARTMAEPHDIAMQIEVELALLMNIEQAFRIALDWKTHGGGNIRKLSTLRFVARTFERHLARLRVLSEHGGYMHLVADMKPHLAGAVQVLKRLRDDLQDHLEQLIVRLEHVSPAETAPFQALCQDLAHYLEELTDHGQKEMELLQECFAQEEGGSG